MRPQRAKARRLTLHAGYNGKERTRGGAGGEQDVGSRGPEYVSQATFIVMSTLESGL